jgi:hypothetical protein
MLKRLPTKLGDVLILTTDQEYRTFAVGRVTALGQQDFHLPSDVKHFGDRDAALASAKGLLLPGGRVFLIDIDTDTWSEIHV